jgi:uncharacterized protein (TIGR03435 family)
MKAILLIASLSSVLLRAQPVPSPAAPKFEVVSIRRHPAQSGPVQVGPTPDGYRSIGLPTFAIFQMAYALPSQSGLLRGNQIDGDPGWLSSELYDVVAKVDQADLSEWQKPQMRQTMLRAMLQAMLTERCHAAVHYGTKEAPVYELAISKDGPKFKQAENVDTADLRQKHPTGGMITGTGTMAVHGPETTVLRHLDGDFCEHDTIEPLGQTGRGQDGLDRELRPYAAIVGPAATTATASRGVATAGCVGPTTRR